MYPLQLVAALEDQLASALFADLVHPCEPCDYLLAQEVEAVQLLEELHAPSPVTIVPTAARQEVHWGPQVPPQPQPDQEKYHAVTRTTICAAKDVAMHTVSCDANCQILQQSTALDAASAAAADAQLLAAAAAVGQLLAAAATVVQLCALAAAVAAVAAVDAVAAVAAAAAASLMVVAGGTGGGTSQGWLGSWQTVAGRRGHAWAGGSGAAERGQQQLQTLQCPGSGLELAQRRAVAGRRSFLKGPQASWLQHRTHQLMSICKFCSV